MTFRTAILAMRLNRKRLVVVLESELYIYDISNMQMLKTEKTSPNPNGISILGVQNNMLMLSSDLCAFGLIRKQLPGVPAPYQGSTRHLPTTITRSPKVRAHPANERRGSHIRCHEAGSGQCD